MVNALFTQSKKGLTRSHYPGTGKATLSLSFKGRTGGLVTATRPFGCELPPFFSNLPPVRHLRDHLARKVGVKPEREFFLMALLGADLAGTVTITPLDHEGQAVGRR